MTDFSAISAKQSQQITVPVQVKIENLPLPEEKTRKVETNQLKSTGFIWLTTHIWARCKQLNLVVIDTLRTAPYFIWVLILRLGSLLLLLSMGIVLIFVGHPTYFGYGVLGFFILIQVVSTCITIKCFVDACRNKQETPYNFGQFVCTVFMEVIVCPLIPFIIGTEHNVYIILITIGFLFLNIIYELNLIFWVFAFFFLGFIGFCEFVYRLAKGELKCPKREPLVLEFKYNLYPYSEILTNEKICAICRAAFQPLEKICCFKCNKSHIFHEECIFTALVTHPLCPLCRQPPIFI